MPLARGAAAATVVMNQINQHSNQNMKDFDEYLEVKTRTRQASIKTLDELLEIQDKSKTKTLDQVLVNREKALEPWMLPNQMVIKRLYDRKSVQLFVAALIMLNFFIAAVNAQMLPVEGEDDGAIRFFIGCEYFFGYAFLIELLFNIYGSFFWLFWRSAWNLFDFVIVIISLMSLYMQDLPGISVLRLFRAFRVVRLFKRIKTMRDMMESILSSLPGMAIAFVALLLIMGIYGIIAVDFWGKKYPDLFGNFLKASLTLLQIMSFDSWSSGIAREIIFSSGVIPVIYFVSYVFIVSIIMMNVLVSLMLDVFMNKKESSLVEAVEELEELQREQQKKFASSEYADRVVFTLGIKAVDKTEPDAPRRTSLSDCVLFVGDSSKSSSNDSTAKRRVINSQLDELNKGIEHFKAYLKENVQGDEIQHSPTDPEWGIRLDGHVQNMIRLLEGLHIELDLLNKELDLVDSKCCSFITHRHGLWGITAQSLGAISK